MGLVGPLLLLLLLIGLLLLLSLLLAIQQAINTFKLKRYTTLALRTPKFANDSALHFDKFDMLLGIELHLKRGLVGLVCLLKRRWIILLYGCVLQRVIDVRHWPKYQ
jgi:hypothetical protein